MALKIEKIWTNIAGSNLVRRKESAARDGDEQRRRHSQQQDPGDGGSERQPSEEEVEKAICELKQSREFSASGVLLSVRSSEGVVSVEFRQPSGVLIKTMAGSEFLRLRSASGGGAAVRGKILDQKF